MKRLIASLIAILTLLFGGVQPADEPQDTQEIVTARFESQDGQDEDVFESVPTVGLYWILLEISGCCWKIVPKKSVPPIRLCSTLVSSTPDQADFASLEKSLESRLFAGLKKEKKGRFPAILRGFSGFRLPLKWTDFESVPVNGF